jgi:hypothetical protein
MRRLAALALATAAVMAMAAGGCKSERKDAGAGSASARAAPMTEAERQRGEDACTSYVKTLCACAAARPDDAELAESCHMKQAKPEALELLLQVDDDPAASDDSRLRAQIEARKLIARCIEEAAQLPAQGCR